jgi:hypothetical protein
LHREALREDPIMGLDTDPVLDSQDPPDAYRIGKVQIKGNLAIVRLIGLRPCGEHILDVTLIQEKANGSSTNLV